jgi:hypothetical protein
MKEYLLDVHNFQEEHITVLMDDGKHTSPTRANILAAYKKIVQESQAGDAVFCHYSGKYGDKQYPHDFRFEIALTK